MTTVAAWSFIDAYALSSLISSFYNVYHDFMVINFAFEQDVFNASRLNGEYEFMKNLGWQVLFVAFFAFLAVRLTLFFRQRERYFSESQDPL